MNSSKSNTVNNKALFSYYKDLYLACVNTFILNVLYYRDTFRRALMYGYECNKRNITKV